MAFPNLVAYTFSVDENEKSSGNFWVPLGPAKFLTPLQLRRLAGKIIHEKKTTE